MEQRVSMVTLGVADLTRSANFYERLGWRRSMAKAEGIVFFQAGGVALALFPRTSSQRTRMFLWRDRALVGSPWLMTLGVVKRLIRCSQRRRLQAPNS
jgi:catechol 2,3-dioxygenase-like lactoylglutathione lyase family enzyme